MFLLALREVCRMDNLKPLLVGVFYYDLFWFVGVFVAPAAVAITA